MKTTESHLGMFGAVFNSLMGLSISHFPRVADPPGRLLERDILAQIEAALPVAGSTDTVAQEVMAAHCRETLDEVKQLTEYQDQKATRLLTIVAFLSALSGVLFSRLSDSYPLWATFRDTEGSLRLAILAGAYLSFACFAIFAISGALVIFHATRTLFKYPSPPSNSVTAKPSSVLFYESILRGTPTEWARTFMLAEDDQGKWDPNIRTRYVRSYISESYLVAAKVADKLRYLQPGQQLLLSAIRFLLAFTVFFALVIAIVPPRTEVGRKSGDNGTTANPTVHDGMPHGTLRPASPATPNAAGPTVATPPSPSIDALDKKATKSHDLVDKSSSGDPTSGSGAKPPAKAKAHK